MTLEDLDLAKNQAFTRELLLEKLRKSEGTVNHQGRFFGVQLDDELEDVMRNAMRKVLRDRLVAVEATLQDLGIIIPDALEPRAPGWDPLAGVVSADPVQP